MDSLQVVQDTLSLMPAGFDIGREVKTAIDSALSTQFFQGGALLAILGGLVYQSKAWFFWGWKRLIRMIKYSVYIDENNVTMYIAFSKWYQIHHPKSFRNVFADIISNEYEQDLDKKYRVRLRQQFDLNIIRYNGRTLFVRKDRETLENSSSLTARHLHKYTIYGFFARRTINKLLDECRAIKTADHKKLKLSKGLKIYYNGHSDWDSKVLSRVKTFDDIFLKQKWELIGDLDNFKSNAPLYEALKIANKRGYLFSGAPGNGKSTIPLAMAKYMDMNIYYINLSSIDSDMELQSYISDVKDNSIIVFEDIDVLAGREDEARASGTRDITPVSFSSLLNVLSGVFEPDNCIFVMTTNHPEKLDDALIRAGRVDMHLKITNPDLGLASAFMSEFYKDHNKDTNIIGYVLGSEDQPENPASIDDFPKNQLSIPMSEVQDYCIRHPKDPDTVKKLLKEKVIT